MNDVMWPSHFPCGSYIITMLNCPFRNFIYTNISYHCMHEIIVIEISTPAKKVYQERKKDTDVSVPNLSPKSRTLLQEMRKCSSMAESGRDWLSTTKTEGVL